VLVEEKNDQINCLLIDFGSCLIRGQDRLPTLSPPWNAPELSRFTHNIRFDDLVQADLFSLALVCLHILLPLDALQDAGLCLFRQQQSDDEWLEFIYKLDQSKQSHTGTDSLASRIVNVISQAAIPNEHKLLLEAVVRNTILPSKGDRTMPWDDIFLLKDYMSTRYNYFTFHLASLSPLRNSSKI
jgi:hypothetical protein